MSEGISYKEILEGHSHYAGMHSKKKALKKKKGNRLTKEELEARKKSILSHKIPPRTESDSDYQKRVGRAYND